MKERVCGGKRMCQSGGWLMAFSSWWGAYKYGLPPLEKVRLSRASQTRKEQSRKV